MINEFNKIIEKYYEYDNDEIDTSDLLYDLLKYSNDILQNKNFLFSIKYITAENNETLKIPLYQDMKLLINEFMQAVHANPFYNQNLNKSANNIPILKKEFSKLREIIFNESDINDCINKIKKLINGDYEKDFLDILNEGSIIKRIILVQGIESKCDIHDKKILTINDINIKLQPLLNIIDSKDEYESKIRDLISKDSDYKIEGNNLFLDIPKQKQGEQNHKLDSGIGTSSGSSVNNAFFPGY